MILRDSTHQRINIVVVFGCLLLGLLIGMYFGGKGIPFVAKEIVWSIGIYTGESPLSTSSGDISNPVLTANDVTDVSASFVADPFMLCENHTWYMFFEVMSNGQDIGLATSEDGLNWAYEQIVLDEPFALSYPYVFKWENEHYMIPDSYQTYSVRLYKAVNFPTEWSFAGTLLNGTDYVVDPSILYFDDMWWLFATSTKMDTLYLYYASQLMGPWILHPKSPIIEGDANIARPGGRVLVFDGRVFRYTQDDRPTYGNQVRAFEITKLTTTSYEEKEVAENPILEGSGAGWNRDGMHHVDLHQINEKRWIGSVDGWRETWVFGLEY